MKILYISSPSFLDVDLSYLHTISKKIEVVYLMDLAPNALKKTVLSIDKQIDKSEIISASEYIEMRQFKKFMNCSAYVINRTKGKFLSLETIRLYFKIKKFIKLQNPDVIHYNNTINLGIFACLLNKYKKVITVHDPIPHIGDKTFINNFIRKLNFLFIKKYIILNQNQKQAFVDLIKCKYSAVYSSQLGVYSYYSKTAPIKKIDTKSEQLTILFFGRLTPYKGIDVLLNAFVEVRKKLNNAQLIIAGSGSFDFNLFDTTNVTLINRYVAANELFNLINNCSFVVCPYIEATQSGVIMTAFSMCKPVIATKVGGLSEMILHNQTGLLVEPNNKNELANAMIDLCINTEKCDEFSVAIQKKYFDDGQFGWNAITNHLITIYKEVQAN